MGAKVILIVALTLFCPSLFVDAENVRLSQVTSVDARGRSGVGLDLRLQLARVNLRYQGFAFGRGHSSRHEALTVRYTRPSLAGTLSGSLTATGDGRVNEHWELDGTLSHLPVEVSLSLNGFTFENFGLNWTAHQPPYRFSPQEHANMGQRQRPRSAWLRAP